MGQGVLVALVGSGAGRAALAEEPVAEVRALGVGGALRAAGGTNAAIFLNPAGVALAQVYHIEAGYQFRVERAQHQGTASIVDSVSSAVAAGLGFSYLGGGTSGETIGSTDTRLALGVALMPQLLVGLGGRWLRVNRDGAGPLGDGAVRGSSELINELTFDVGIMAKLSDNIFIGAVGQNLTNLRSTLAPLLVGGGVAYTVTGVALADLDVVFDLTTYPAAQPRFHLGGEYLAADRFPLRIGYVFDAGAGRHSIAAGLGYVEERYGADIAVRRDVAGGSETVLSLGVKMFLN